MELKTSFEWQNIKGIVIMDPDGWDRNNLYYSFYEEKISEAEYDRRAAASTISYVPSPERF